MVFLQPAQFKLFAVAQCGELSFFKFLVERFLKIVNDVDNGKFTYVAQVLVPTLIQFLKAAKSYNALDVLYDEYCGKQEEAQSSMPDKDSFVNNFLYEAIVDMCSADRMNDHHRRNNAYTKKCVKVSILAGRTGPKVFMQVASDGSVLYINGEWFWEAEHCLNNVNVDRHDSVENIRDIHCGVGTLKMLHEFMHILTPLFIDFDEYLKDRVLKQENVAKLQITPEELGTRMDSTLGTIGDLGYVVEEHLLGDNQRLFVKRAKNSTCDLFWKLHGIFTETILFDRVTKKPSEFSTNTIANAARLLANLVRKDGPFNFTLDFKANISAKSTKRSASDVEATETTTHSGRIVKKVRKSASTVLFAASPGTSDTEADENYQSIISLSAGAQERDGITNTTVKT